MTLIEMLSSIEDTRKRRGIRHKMPNFLIMCLTAIMSGYTGYREIGRFLKENQWEFKKYILNINELLYKVYYFNY